MPALALGLIGDARAVEPLCRALRDAQEYLHSTAAWALGTIGDPRAIQPLLDAQQHDTNPRVHVQLAYALYRLGRHDAVLTLADLSSSTDEVTRATALYALQHCDDPRAARPLLLQLIEQPDDETTAALGRLHCAQAVPVLLSLLQEREFKWPNNDWRVAATKALGAIGEGKPGAWQGKITEMLNAAAAGDPAPEVRAAAALALARLQAPQSTELLEGVMRHYLPERNAAIRALWTVPGNAASELLAGALQDDDPLGQVLAAHGLMLRHDPRGEAALRTLVTTVSEPVALQVAVRYAGELCDAALAPTLCRLACAGCDDAKIFLPVEATLALAHNPAPEATDTLIALLASPSSRLREAAARALAGTTNPEARAGTESAIGKGDGQQSGGGSGSGDRTIAVPVLVLRSRSTSFRPARHGGRGLRNLTE